MHLYQYIFNLLILVNANSLLIQMFQIITTVDACLCHTWLVGDGLRHTLGSDGNDVVWLGVGGVFLASAKTLLIYSNIWYIYINKHKFVQKVPKVGSILASLQI